MGRGATDRSVLVSHECIHARHVISNKTASYSPQTRVSTILYIRAQKRTRSAQPVDDFSVFPRLHYLNCKADEAERNDGAEFSLCLISWLFLVGLRLPAHRRHIHSAVSTWTAELSVS